MAITNMFYGATPEIFERARKLRENMTYHETLLWNRLKDKSVLGTRIKAQHPIDQFIADFYCHKYKLVIEIDGDSHNMIEQKQIDKHRTDIMNSLGINIIRFDNSMIENEMDKVIEQIKKCVNQEITNTYGITTKDIYRIDTQSEAKRQDTIAIESPLEIRIKKESDLVGKSVAVTMRTPGNDIELALGFIFTEGILKEKDDIIEAQLIDENVVELTIKNESVLNLSQSDRNFYTTSSCGVCGKASIDAIKIAPDYHIEKCIRIHKSVLFNLQEKLLQEQSAFEATGGIHASALFDLEGNLLELREDVGRHNALDKLIGASWQKGTLPLSESILLLSGRASFELVQKASMAGIPFILAVGAPSSLAIDLAQEHNHTLIGFLKTNRFNIYTGHERIEV